MSRISISGTSCCNIFYTYLEQGFTIHSEYRSKGLNYCFYKVFSNSIFCITLFENKYGQIIKAKISVTNLEIDEIAIVNIKNMFKNLCKISYEGSDNGKLQEWIENNFDSTTATNLIGKAKFKMQSMPLSKYLTIEGIYTKY